MVDCCWKHCGLKLLPHAKGNVLRRKETWHLLLEKKRKVGKEINDNTGKITACSLKDQPVLDEKLSSHDLIIAEYTFLDMVIKVGGEPTKVIQGGTDMLQTQILPVMLVV